MGSAHTGCSSGLWARPGEGGTSRWAAAPASLQMSQALTLKIQWDVANTETLPAAFSFNEVMGLLPI